VQARALEGDGDGGNSEEVLRAGGEPEELEEGLAA
jgi:hypothetical protein